MANWNLAEKQIYKLLKHPCQKEKSEIEAITAAYLEFVEELFDYLNKENDNKTRIRQLNMSYIDFGTIKALEETSPTGNSKLKIIYLDKLLSLINMEQELIYRQMEYPKFFINIESDWKSPFYLNSEVIKIIDIMELVCGIFYIKDGIIRIDNKDIFLSDISRIFEKMFNISFGDIYKKEISVIKRKPTKITTLHGTPLNIRLVNSEFAVESMILSLFIHSSVLSDQLSEKMCTFTHGYICCVVTQR